MLFSAFLTMWTQYLCCFSFNDKYDIIESHTSRKKQFSVTHTSEVNRDSWDYQNKSTHKK